MNYIKKATILEKLKKSKFANKNFLNIQNWTKIPKTVLRQPCSGRLKKVEKPQKIRVKFLKCEKAEN